MRVGRACFVVKADGEELCWGGGEQLLWTLGVAALGVVPLPSLLLRELDVVQEVADLFKRGSVVRINL